MAAMPVTRSKTTPIRSHSVPLSPHARSIIQPPLYQTSTPVVLPLPVIRTTLVYSEDGELPLVLLQRSLPRPALHRRTQPHNVSINPKHVTIPQPLHVLTQRSMSRETLPPSRELSPLTDDSDDASVDPDEATIPKPPGEAGRPESGGYNLEVAVNWNSSEFVLLKVAFHSLSLIPSLIPS
jgi:hypothetical protein